MGCQCFLYGIHSLPFYYIYLLYFFYIPRILTLFKCLMFLHASCSFIYGWGLIFYSVTMRRSFISWPIITSEGFLCLDRSFFITIWSMRRIIFETLPKEKVIPNSILLVHIVLDQNIDKSSMICMMWWKTRFSSYFCIHFGEEIKQKVWKIHNFVLWYMTQKYHMI